MVTCVFGCRNGNFESKIAATVRGWPAVDPALGRGALEKQHAMLQETGWWNHVLCCSYRPLGYVSAVRALLPA